MNSAQALEFRRPAKSSQIIEKLVSDYRKHVPFMNEDKIMYTYIESSVQFLKKTKFDI
jgi:histidine ammonia-lyase